MNGRRDHNADLLAMSLVILTGISIIIIASILVYA